MHPVSRSAQWMFKLLSRIEAGEADSNDLDMLLELAGSMGIMPGTTICGLADGHNWAVRTVSTSSVANLKPGSDPPRRSARGGLYLFDQRNLNQAAPPMRSGW